MVLRASRKEADTSPTSLLLYPGLIQAGPLMRMIQGRGEKALNTFPGCLHISNHCRIYWILEYL